MVESAKQSEQRKEEWVSAVKDFQSEMFAFFEKDTKLNLSDNAKQQTWDKFINATSATINSTNLDDLNDMTRDYVLKE